MIMIHLVRAFCFAIVCLCLLTVSTQAQGTTVTNHLQQVAKGWTVDAKKSLPDLLLEQPDDPGVTFLHATLVEEPAKAIPLYERIVDRFPTSEWADDALLRLVINACTQKDATRANKYFKQMRQSFASSALLPVAYDVMRMSVGVPPPDAVTSTSTTSTTASTTPVETPTASTADTKSYPYTLAAITTPDKDQAKKLVSKYQSKHLKADMAEKWIKGKRNYVVQIGYYESEANAASDLDTVRKVCGCKPVVSKRMP